MFIMTYSYHVGQLPHRRAQQGRQDRESLALFMRSGKRSKEKYITVVVFLLLADTNDAPADRLEICITRTRKVPGI